MSIFSHTLDISQTDLEQRGQANLFNEEYNMEMISKIVQLIVKNKKKEKKVPALTEDDPAFPSSSICE